MGPLPAQTSPTAAATGTTTAASSSFTPYLPPPPGQSSDRENPESLEQLADVAIGICLPLITIFFFARCYVRAFLKRTWIFEDYLVTVVWAGAVAYCGIMRATMSHNGGRHAWDITASEAHEALYWFNVAAIEYGVMIGLAKISVLVFYRRVFSPIRWSWFDITIVGLIALMAGFYTSITIAKIFECDPREKIWNASVPGHCVEISMILNISGGFNTITDYIILLLPVQAVSQLKITQRKRLLVILAFTFGLWYAVPPKHGKSNSSCSLALTLYVAHPSSPQSALSFDCETATTRIPHGNSPTSSSGELRSWPPETLWSASPRSPSCSVRGTARAPARVTGLPHLSSTELGASAS